MSKATIERLLTAEDWDGLAAEARDRPSRVLRYVIGRLSTADEAEKRRALEALGHLVADESLVSKERVVELMRRFLWALNDESGDVPFGIPEAIGEVLARRPEFQETYLPILGSFLTDEEMVQSGHIERGVVWGLGRVGPAVAARAAHAVDALVRAAEDHADPETRVEAARALVRIRAETGEAR